MELAGIEVRYGRAEPVLHGLDLQLGRGESVVVHGPNGSGKSTLLRVVAGCARPTSGRIRGRPRHVGYVPDRFPSQLRMPAASYLRHMAALHRTREDATGVLDELGFTGGLGVPMVRLSTGNAQKVALAQALCSGATLLVLDEPWSGLDTAAVAAVSARIAAAADRGAAVLITDHTGVAAALPGRTLLDLVGGRLVPAAEPSGPFAVVVLVCADPAQTLARLPDVACTVSGDRITLRVLVTERDALLRAALDWGCGVHAVGPEPPR